MTQDLDETAGGASKASESTEGRSEQDWGLSQSKPRMSLAAKLGLVAVLALAGAGGYVVYQKLSQPKTELAATEQTESEENRPDAAGTKSDATPAAPAVPGGIPAAGDSIATATPADRADPFENEVAEPMDAGFGEQTEPSARQIPDLDAPATVGLAANTSFPEANDFADAAPPPIPADGVLDLDDAEGDLELKPPAALPQTASKPGTGAGALDVETDPPAMLAFPPAGKNAIANASESSKDGDLAEKLDGFDIASDEDSQETLPAAATLPTMEDDRLGDYVAEEVGSNRAVSRTVVQKPVAQLQPSIPADSQPILPAARGAAEFEGRIEVASNEPPLQKIQPRAAAIPESPVPFPADDPLDAIDPLAESPKTAVIQRKVPPVPDLDMRPQTPLASFREPVASGQTSDPANEMYIVLPHDNFWKISRKQYGTVRYFMALTRHNAALVSDPMHMKPGMQISTPPRAILEGRYPELIEGSASASRPLSGTGAALNGSPGGEETRSGFFMGPGGEPMYRIGHDDTLTGISQRHLGRASRWVEIMDQNRDLLATPDNLKIGTEIRLPTDASRLSLVRPGSERR